MDEAIAEPSGPRPRPGWHRVLPPFWAMMILAAVIGGIIGLGGYTFVYANGFSYLSDDPKACVNCHIMWDVYDGWNHSSHKAVATCNDCHVPHTLVAKYAIKALSGINHSTAFTTGNFPEPIRINSRDRAIAQQNCLYCHGDLVTLISHQDSPDPTDCLTCHGTVGHGR